MNAKHFFWFIVLCAVLWGLISLVYFFTGGFYWDAPGLIFGLSSIPGQLLLFALGLSLLVGLCRVIGPKTAVAGGVIFGGIFTLFFLLDAFVFTQYRFHISLAMLELFFGPAGREIFVFPWITYLILALAIAAVFALVYGLTRLAGKITWGKRAIWAVCILWLGAFLVYNGMHAWGKFMIVPSVLAQVSYMPWANPLSANRKLRRMGFEPKAEPYSTPKQGSLNYPLAPMQCKTDKPLNILIILIDSWCADSFTQEVMPNTWQAYQQAKDAFYFTNHLSGGNATEAGMFSLFYSMPYLYWNSFTSRQLPPVFMQVIQQQGYQLGIFASSKLNSPEFHQNIFASVPDLRIESKGGTKVERDRDAQQDFTAFIKHLSPDKPFFGFLFYDAAHGQEFPEGGDVFKPVGEQMNYLTLTKNTDPAPYMNRYKNSVHFIDGLIGQVFDLLKQQNLLDNTVIVLSGDHGQEINDTRNNFWGHNSNFAKWQTHVPLLVWWPGKQGKEMAYRTSHYDIMPALLIHALGCTNPVRDYSTGMDLFDPQPRPYTIISSYTKKAVQTGDKISVIDNYGYLEHYDENFHKLPSGADPKAISTAFKDFAQFYK